MREIVFDLTLLKRTYVSGAPTPTHEMYTLYTDGQDPCTESASGIRRINVGDAEYTTLYC